MTSMTLLLTFNIFLTLKRTFWISFFAKRNGFWFRALVLLVQSHKIYPVSPLLPSAEANLLIKYRAFGSSSPISSFFCLLTCNFSYSIFPVDICIQIGASLCSSVSSVLFLVEFLTTVLVMDSPLKSLVLYLRHLHSSLHHSGLHFFGLHHHNILFQVLFNMVTFDLVEFCWTFTNGNNQLR